MDAKTKERYNEWKDYASLVDYLLSDMNEIADDEDEINDRFYRELEFGTAGLRGVRGAGTNRINVYTVARATEGYAKYLKSVKDDPVIAIAYDSRIQSDTYAYETATVMAANGVKVYIWPVLMPTPMLSFAIRHYHCDGGVVITASHNPSQYNGYKAYGPDGAQLGQDEADKVYENILAANIFAYDELEYTFEDGIKDGLIEYITKDVYDKFIDACSALSLADESVDKSVRIAYTPLYGTGLKPVTDCLKRNGFTNVMVVKEQEKPNGEFPTCPYPNPEFRQAMEVVLEFAMANDADILIATDPDADRIGIAVRNGDDYALLTGNETGLLMLDYICAMKKKTGKMPENPVAVKTIVSSDLVGKLAEDYGVEIRDTLTGFKNIGAIVTELSDAGEIDRFIFSYEESYGYMLGDHVRDKDAVSAALLIAEMFAYHKTAGKSLLERLEEIYAKLGYYKNETRNYQFPGESGFMHMQEIMEYFRSNPPKSIGGHKVLTVEDYLPGFNGLPKSNVLKYKLDGFHSVVIRPSGTEPKIKLYLGVSAADEKAAEAEIENIAGELEEHLK